MTGIEPLQQAWTVVRNGGYVRTCSIGHPAGANVTFPAAQWANAGKTHVPGNYAGVQALRDLPRFVRLIENGAVRREVDGRPGVRSRQDARGAAGGGRSVRDHVGHSVQLTPGVDLTRVVRQHLTAPTAAPATHAEPTSWTMVVRVIQMARLLIILSGRSPG